MPSMSLIAIGLRPLPVGRFDTSSLSTKKKHMDPITKRLNGLKTLTRDEFLTSPVFLLLPWSKHTPSETETNLGKLNGVLVICEDCRSEMLYFFISTLVKLE